MHYGATDTVTDAQRNYLSFYRFQSFFLRSLYVFRPKMFFLFFQSHSFIFSISQSLSFLHSLSLNIIFNWSKKIWEPTNNTPFNWYQTSRRGFVLLFFFSSSFLYLRKHGPNSTITNSSTKTNSLWLTNAHINDIRLTSYGRRCGARNNSTKVFFHICACDLISLHLPLSHSLSIVYVSSYFFFWLFSISFLLVVISICVYALFFIILLDFLIAK